MRTKQTDESEMNNLTSDITKEGKFYTEHSKHVRLS